MQALIRGTLRGVIRTGIKPFFSERTSVGFQRGLMRVATASSGLPARKVIRVQRDMGGVGALESRPSGAAQRRDGAMLFCHGGGYCIGSPATHRGLTGHLARALGQSVFSLDYRLAPEHPCPAALDDALAAYRWLLDEGYSATQISLGGDSAGGGLVLALAIRLRDENLPLPAALALISPWTDLTLGGPTLASNARRDPLLTADILHFWANHYLGETSSRSPDCSPLFGELGGLPPTCINVGSDEVLLSDSTRLAEAIRAAGGEVDLHQYEDMWHDFPLHAGLLREADQAIARIADFVLCKH